MEINKPKMIMMVGLVGSGKSTHAKDLSIMYNANIHSSDSIREELFSDVNNQDNNDKVFAELNRRIKEDLKNGKSIILDATNINFKRRIEFIQELKTKNIYCEKICAFVATPYEQCLEQNKKRDRFVPEHVIKRMYLNFNIPQMYEGWDDIIVLWNYNNEKFDMNELFNGDNGLNKIEQDNPHHRFTIGKHCQECSKEVSFLTENNNIDNISFTLALAGLFHDIGKKFTKSFENSKREVTEKAHYYNHENVSAYDAMFYLKNRGLEKKQILEIVKYIQWHMQPFHMNGSEKAITKFKDIVGDEFYENLLILHEADKKSH